MATVLDYAVPVACIALGLRVALCAAMARLITKLGPVFDEEAHP